MPTDKPKIVTGLNVGWFMSLHRRLLEGQITFEQYEQALKKEREARNAS